MRDWPQDRWPDFEPGEVVCRCAESCGYKNPLLISAAAMDLLQAVRYKVARPVVILSALRCPAHNASVGGAARSRHVQYLAIDFTFKDIEPVEFARRLAREFGWQGGIGAYPSRSFVHIDADTSPSVRGRGKPRHWVSRKGKLEMVDFREDEGA